MKKLLFIVSALCALLFFVSCVDKEASTNKITVEEYSDVASSVTSSNGNSNSSTTSTTETSSNSSSSVPSTTDISTATTTTTPSTTSNITTGGAYSDTGNWGPVQTK